VFNAINTIVGGQYQDRQDCPCVMVRIVKLIFPSPPIRAISFPLVHTTILGQSVYPDIALHFSNYYINICLSYFISEDSNA